MNESGTQLLARLEARRSLRDVEPRLFPEDGGPEPGEVVELFGPEGAGKTELLYHLLSRCVLPEAAGGLEMDVLFLDTHHGLDMFRLVSVLDHRLGASAQAPPTKQAPPTGQAPPTDQAPPPGPVPNTRMVPPTDQAPPPLTAPPPPPGPAPPPRPPSPEEALRGCLRRLLVVTVCGSAQLLLTLHSLENALRARPRLGLLLIDGLTAHRPHRARQDRQDRQDPALSRCCALLARLLRDYRFTVFATCHPVRRGGGGPGARWAGPGALGAGPGALGAGPGTWRAGPGALGAGPGA
ncbi:DNA repair protein XRCC2 [Menidia menidia]